jgi:glycosyltransferase domain-containing protein
MIKVAIIIPTKNRIDFLIRLLNYYRTENSIHPIYIGDASEVSNFDIIEKFNTSITNFKINYHHLPNLNIRKTITYLGNLVKEEFCAIICDDDYLVPNSLTKCANFLNSNLDYRTAQGKSIIFTLKNIGPYGHILWSGEYWTPMEFNHNNSIDRLKYFSNNYFVPQFSVHRTNEFNEDSIFYSQIEDESFGELLHCFTFLCKGKSKFLDCLYLVRQDHISRYLLPTPIEWITNSEWNKSYQFFIKSLSASLSIENKLTIIESEVIIKALFNDYLSNSISKRNKRNPQNTSITYKYYNYIKNFNIKFINNFMNKLKHILYRYNNKFDFNILRDKNSIYYDDMISIYNNFNKDNL